MMFDVEHIYTAKLAEKSRRLDVFNIKKKKNSLVYRMLENTKWERLFYDGKGFDRISNWAT